MSFILPRLWQVPEEGYASQAMGSMFHVLNLRAALQGEGFYCHLVVEEVKDYTAPGIYAVIEPRAACSLVLSGADILLLFFSFLYFY